MVTLHLAVHVWHRLQESCRHPAICSFEGRHGNAVQLEACQGLLAAFLATAPKWLICMPVLHAVQSAGQWVFAGVEGFVAAASGV